MHHTKCAICRAHAVHCALCTVFHVPSAKCTVCKDAVAEYAVYGMSSVQFLVIKQGAHCVVWQTHNLQCVGVIICIVHYAQCSISVCNGARFPSPLPQFLSSVLVRVRVWGQWFTGGENAWTYPVCTYGQMGLDRGGHQGTPPHTEGAIGVGSLATAIPSGRSRVCQPRSPREPGFSTIGRGSHTDFI